MKKFGLIVLILFFITPIFLSAQAYKGRGRLKGTVTDELGAPLEGVKIKLFNEKRKSGFEVFSDAKGRWKAFNIAGGNYKIDFEKIGYMPNKISYRVNEYGKNPDIEMKLEKVEGLVITDELKEQLNAGNTLFDEGKFQEALQAYQILIEENPDAYVLHLNIGNCHFQMDQYEEAETSYQKVLEQDPENHEVMLAIGNTYANRGMEEQALEWYNKIEFEKITDPMVLFNIGSKFYQQNKYEDALRYYQRAVEIKEDFLDALYQLGLAYLTLGNNAEAINIFEKYLTLDSDSEKASQVKGFLDYLKR